jgi:hypothetical protein
MCTCPLDLSHNMVGEPEERKKSCGLATVFGKFVSGYFTYFARSLAKYGQGTKKNSRTLNDFLCLPRLETSYACDSGFHYSCHTVFYSLQVRKGLHSPWYAGTSFFLEFN